MTTTVRPLPLHEGAAWHAFLLVPLLLCDPLALMAVTSKVVATASPVPSLSTSLAQSPSPWRCEPCACRMRWLLWIIR